MNRDDLLGVVPVPGSDRIDATRSGIYWGGSMEGSRIGNREGSTRPASIEVLYPERPGANLQVDAAVEGHSWRLLKRSFRLVFKAEYGSGKLRAPFFEEAPLNAGTATAVYDRIVLRSGKNRSWATNWHPSRSTYTRDQWARDTQIAMSGLGSHGTFVHLYINGLYWGLYNACERPDAWFLAAYLGGEAADWFSVNEDGVFHGDPARWNYLRQELKNKDMAVASNYRELQDYLNVTQFADYLILCWYMHNQDWPDYNWFAGHRVNPPQPMMFFVWDSELTWETGPAPAAWVHPRFRSDQHTDEPNMVGIWHSLRRNPDFMTLFADRVYRHCLRDGGALTESESMARWRTLNAFVEDATLAESARWGDARREVGAATRTRENTFYPEAERVAGRMRGNVEQFIDALRRERYYPALDPPRLVYSTSLMGTGSVEVSNPNGGAGVVYYTLNGDDPRASGGTLSPAARSTVGPERITLARSMTMKARVKDRSEWSTLATTPFTD
jgi:hypothetical protein